MENTIVLTDALSAACSQLTVIARRGDDIDYITAYCQALRDLQAVLNVTPGGSGAWHVSDPELGLDTPRSMAW